ncbi:MAG TPA: iron-containing alcohol dehydrogenase family protein [Ramlibacter sp.]|nr:iron-containing alcohol dehydrogenase family protein [Ramlibacter sp.]
MRLSRHIAPPLRIFSGPDSLGAIRGELARVNSTRAVVLCGASLSRDGLVDPVTAAIGERCAGVFSGVVAHSPLPAVEAAAEALHQLQADAVVAVGGGSAIVTARAASILLAEQGDARALCTSRDASGEMRSPKLLAPKLPQLVVPTTPTTATVKAGSAVLDPVDGRRLALFDPKTRAQSVFVHPQLLEATPRDLVVSAGLNTLAMAIEGLMSRSGDPFSDALLMHALRMLVRGLPRVDREDLMMASLMCGHGTDFTGAGIAIPLGHAISARFHVDNGLANAVVMPHVLRFNAEAAPSGLHNLATALDIHDFSVESVVDALDPVLNAPGLPQRLRDLGVTRESLPQLASVSFGDWFVRDNPRKVRDAEELLGVLEAAW